MFDALSGLRSLAQYRSMLSVSHYFVEQFLPDQKFAPSLLSSLSSLPSLPSLSSSASLSVLSTGHHYTGWFGGETLSIEQYCASEQSPDSASNLPDPSKR